MDDSLSLIEKELCDLDVILRHFLEYKVLLLFEYDVRSRAEVYFSTCNDVMYFKYEKEA